MPAPRFRTLVGTCLLSFCATTPAQASARDCGLEPPGTPAWPKLPVKPAVKPVMRGEPPLVQRQAPDARGSAQALTVDALRMRGGALRGKTVYVSAGHGFTWTDNQNAWRTQRGNTDEIVEDLVSAETASQYLVPLLMNAGAVVRGVRELDPNPNMAIVDDADVQAGYEEHGAAAEFANGPPGWGKLPGLLSDSTPLFHDGQSRTLKAAAQPTAGASWTPTFPADGKYNVYLAFTDGPDRVRDAHYRVKHAGGVSELRVNQQRHGWTWVLLGTWYFRAGKSAALGSLELLNDSSHPDGRVVSLDAVRFGGGRSLTFDRNQTTQPAAGRGSSGRPRWEESGRYGAQFQGAVRDVFDNPTLTDRDDDIGSRPRFAAWDHVDGEDAVYVAWHTNATGTPDPGSTGTETYVYGEGGPYQCPNPTPVAGSLELGSAVHNELVNDLRLGIRPNWTDRKLRCAYFGELNPLNNPKMPAILIEVAFHEKPPDSTVLKEARFRYTAARAIVQGIIKYWGAKDGRPVLLPPEPPVAISAVAVSGKLEVRWALPAFDRSGLAGDDPSSFRVYSSRDGLAWDDGVEVSALHATFAVRLGEVRYFRVASVNAAGESLPSEAVGARATENRPSLLVVNGFSRLDASLNLTEDLSAWALGRVKRVKVDRMNDGTYVRFYGEAFTEGFDSASSGAVDSSA
ncbi:MAG: golvesin C-terminal-like domain-containing protein, partial [Myxococcaceae bacterium]